MPSDEDGSEKSYKFDELSPEAKKRAIEKWREKGWDWDDFDTTQLTEVFEARLEELGLPNENVHWSLISAQGDGVSFEGKIDIQEYLKKHNLLRKYASLFAPAYEQPTEQLVGPKQRDQAEAVARSVETLGLLTEVRKGTSCFYVDVFENGNKMDWMATFCVGKKRGRRDNVSVESESGAGTGAWLLKRAGERFASDMGQMNYDIPMNMMGFRIISSSRYYSMSLEYDVGISENWLSPEQKRDFEDLHEYIKEQVDDAADELMRMGQSEIEYRSSDESITETLEANDYDFDEDGDMIS
jgi:hypothetical protein